MDPGLQGSYAWEYAYPSIGAGAHAAFHLAERNTTLGVSFQGYFDTVRLIRFNGVDEADETRNTWSATAEWTQILTPDSLRDVTLWPHTAAGVPGDPVQLRVRRRGRGLREAPRLAILRRAGPVQTSDPDLGDLMGHMVALRTSFIHMDFRGLGGTWDLGGSYYYRDNGLHMAWFDVGYHFEL